jgi:hypothetical protein
MDNNQALQTQAEKLLERMKTLPPRDPGEPLRPTEELHIMQLTERGLRQEAIAVDVGCHQSTVSRTIAKYTDTRPLARKRLEAEALTMAERIITDGKPETLLKVMAKLDVVRDEDARPADAGVIIQIGFAGVPVPTPGGRGTWNAPTPRAPLSYLSESPMAIIA